MAQLLGSKFCLESLQHDVKDIEEIVNEISSRVGVVKTQSWKFPDKNSCEVDVTTLLQDCIYDENEEEDNQVAHVMLYDLLIDRLVFMLQNFARYNELLLAPEDLPSNVGKGQSSLSAGLSAKRCWSRVTQVATVLQQLAKEVQKKTKALDREETKVAEFNKVSSQNPSINHASPTMDRSNKSSHVAFEAANRSCQTTVTAYSTCETCARVQQCLHEVGKSVVKVCKSQGLPTSLEDYIAKQSDSSIMSIAEVTRWKNLQTKDLSRIDRQLDNLLKQVKPLKEDISAAVRKECEAKSEIERLRVLAERREKEFQEEQRKREYKLKELTKSLQIEVDHVKKENDLTSEELLSLKEQLSQLKDELIDKHRQLVQAENGNSMLREEAKENRQFQKDSVRLQADLNEMKRLLQDRDEKIQQSNQQLQQEILKNTTLSSHEQAMQEKQSGLLKRLDELDEECEELRERLNVADEEREEAEDKAKEEEEKRSSLNKQVASKEELVTVLQQDNDTLERRMDDLKSHNNDLESTLGEYIERERLLVAYPDLHKTQNLGLPESSGDVFTDMQRQVEANQIRIDVLEKENRSLMKTLSNALPVQLNGSDPVRETATENQPEPIQLWGRKDFDQISHTTSNISGSSVRLASKIGRSTGRSPSPSYLGDQSNRSNAMATYHNIKQKQKSSPVRSSFHIGPGKQRAKTPTTSTPTSGRSALVKPWT